MDQNITFSQNMDTLFTDLHKFVKTDTVLGTPMNVGDKTLVPLMSVTFGYGSTGMGKNQNNTNQTGGMANGIGLGARVSTSAVVVIEKNSVQMLPVNEKSNMSQMLEKLPQALSSMGQQMGQGGMGQGQQGQIQNQAQGQQGQQGQMQNQALGQQGQQSR